MSGHVAFTTSRNQPWGQTVCRCECGASVERPTAFEAYQWHDRHRSHPYQGVSLKTRPGPSVALGLAIARGVRSYRTP